MRKVVVLFSFLVIVTWASETRASCMGCPETLVCTVRGQGLMGMTQCASGPGYCNLSGSSCVGTGGGGGGSCDPLTEVCNPDGRLHWKLKSIQVETPDARFAAVEFPLDLLPMTIARAANNQWF